MEPHIHRATRFTYSKLPILKILAAAWALPLLHPKALLRIASPIMLSGALLFALIYFIDDSNNLNSVQIGWLVVACILWLYAILLAVIGSHRIYLLSNNDDHHTKAFRFSKVELRYVGWLIAIGLTLLIAIVPFVFFVTPWFSTITSGKTLALLSFALNIPIAYLLGRFSMVLPAAAVGMSGITLDWSWNMTKGNGWRLAFVIHILPMAWTAVFNLLPLPDTFLILAIKFTLWLVVGAVEIALLSMSYGFLVRQQPGEDSFDFPVLDTDEEDDNRLAK